MSIMLWLATREFQEDRVDHFETLLLQLTRTSGMGIPLYTQLELWAQRDKSRNNPRWRVFAYAAKQIRNGGASFALAFKPFLPSDEFLLLQAGGFNNDLAGALRQVCDLVATKGNMLAAVGVVLLTGLSTLSSVFLTAIILGIFMWPEFLDLAPIQYWDSWCVPLIHFHQFVAAHWIVIAAMIGSLFPLYYKLAPNWVGRGRKWADYFPPFSVYRGLQSVGLLSAMGALIQSGVTVREAFVQISSTVPPYLKWHVLRMLRRYDASGEDSIKAIRTGLFTQAMQDRIEDAARGQSFDEVLKQVGTRSTDMMQRVLKQQMMFLSGILMTINLLALGYTGLVLVVGADSAQSTAIKAEENGTRLIKK